MKILFYTNMFPSIEEKVSGIFIYRRLIHCIDQGIGCKVIRTNSIIKYKKCKVQLKHNYSSLDAGLDQDISVQVINYLSNPRIIFSRYLLKKIKKIFFKEQFDLIHAHFVSDCYPIYLLKKKYSIPYIVTAHGSDIHTFPFQNKKNKEIVLNVLENSNRSIFVSKYLLNKARELGYSGKNSIVIPNGIDFNVFRKAKEGKGNLFKKEGKIVAFIGSLKKIKGADFLPGIFFEIEKVHKDIKLLIIGDGELKELVQEELKRNNLLNKTIFTGYISPLQVAGYLNDIDVLLVPSRDEGFSCATLEAQAAGVPVVATNIPSVRELIGEVGLLVDQGPFFEKMFANTVIRLMDTPIPKSQMIDRAKQFDWQKIIKKEIELYHEEKKNVFPINL